MKAEEAGGQPFGLLLFLLSGPDDKAPDWSSLTVETTPRQRVIVKSDPEAMEDMSRMVAGIDAQKISSRSQRIGPFPFMVTRFRKTVGGIQKYAEIYTTIMDKTLVSFAFGANQERELARITASMQTLTPLPPQ